MDQTMYEGGTSPPLVAQSDPRRAPGSTVDSGGRILGLCVLCVVSGGFLCLRFRALFKVQSIPSINVSVL